MKQEEVVILGSGNVATHLGKALLKNNYVIKQVFSSSIENAKKLSVKLKCQKYTATIQEIDTTSDLYIIALKDDLIKDFSDKIKLTKKTQIIVHTSGSVSIDVLKKDKANYGVVYPLQTFSKNKRVDFRKVPLCIEGNNGFTNKKLQELANALTESVYKINSEQRLKIHLAAVFANNFANSMYQLANEILQDNKVPFDILKPLILETAKKVQYHNPAEMQTGPAKRGDLKVIKKHLELLSADGEKSKIYKIISDIISKRK